MKKGGRGEDDEQEEDYTLVVKNLDTGETVDIDEASVKFSVMGLDRARSSPSPSLPLLLHCCIVLIDVPLTVQKKKINLAVSSISTNRSLRRMRIIISMPC